MPSQGFQTQVYDQPALGIRGDFASNNPRSSYDVGPGGLVAGAAGVSIGRFCWVVPPLDPNGTPTIANSFGSGFVAGFVPSKLQGSNSTYLSNSGMSILPGYEMWIATGGDYLAVNEGTTQATRGMKAYADFLTGKVSFAASGAPLAGASATGSSIAASTFSATGSLSGNILTVTAVASGTNVASGTHILAQLTSTAVLGALGSTGTYEVDIPEQTAASTTISGTYGTFTVGTLTTTPVFAVGDTLNATGSVVSGTQITQALTGTGGSGSTFAVNNNTVVASQVISAASNVETPFYALNSALAGEIVKIGAAVTSYGAQLS